MDEHHIFYRGRTFNRINHYVPFACDLHKMFLSKNVSSRSEILVFFYDVDTVYGWNQNVEIIRLNWLQPPSSMRIQMFENIACLHEFYVINKLTRSGFELCQEMLTVVRVFT